MIAQKPSGFGNGSLPTFLADDSGGKGTTIYIIDDGFDVNIEVLSSIKFTLLD